MNKEELAKMIDHSVLHPTTTKKDIEKACKELFYYGFGTICVPPAFVLHTASYLCLSSSAYARDANVATVINFPNGYSQNKICIEEALSAFCNGASELDVVLCHSAIKDTSQKYCSAVINLIDLANQFSLIKEVSIKAIIETCYLSNEDIYRVSSELAEAAQLYPIIKFVKTSTGFGSAGATAEHVALIKKAVGNSLGIKASGGIKTWKQCKEMIDAGATRIGTSSGVKIIKEFEETEGKNYDCIY
jgi:deoxyribose-phosphate aldolase